MDPARPWQRFGAGTPVGQLCALRARELHREPLTPSRPVKIPASLGHPHRKPASTQAALGRFLADLAHDAPEAAARVVTCSPDVASSTNLGGWINKTGSGRCRTGTTGSRMTPSGSCAGGRGRQRRGDLPSQP